MTVTVKNDRAELVVPASVRRRASIKAGDRLEFRVSPGTITITVSQPTYKPTKAEESAIRKGEAAIASGDYVTLGELSYPYGADKGSGNPPIHELAHLVGPAGFITNDYRDPKGRGKQ